MTVPRAVARGRTAAEARMLSRCTIRRKTAGSDANGFPIWDVIHTALPLRLAGIARGQSQSRRVQTGAIEFEVAMRTANFPADTSDLRDGDLVDITSGDSTGMVLRIVEADWADQSTARRVPVVATGRPEEWS